MAITDLTGYTWVGNNSISITTQDIATYNINGEGHFLNNQGPFDGSFTSIQLLRSTDPNAAVLYCDNDIVYFSWWSGPEPFTISFTGGTDATNSTLIAWLEANGTLTLTPPEPAGYEVTFVTNGGTSITNLENVEELPTPLPTTTKTNNIFVGWFYDSGFEVQAFSGDTISSNITLYAKWYANMEDFYEDVADAIRSKNGETNPIKHSEFAYKIKNIQGAKPEETKTITSPDFSSGNVVVTPDAGKVLTEVTVVKDNDLVPENIVKDVDIFGVVGTAETVVELTQAQYDALSVYDDNTYYLIVEE